MTDTATAAPPADAAPAAGPTRPSRLRWYLVCLFALLALAFYQREQFARLTNGMARRAMTEGRNEDAATWLKRSKQISKTYPETEFLLGRAARHAGRLEEAHKHFLRAKHLGYPLDVIEREQWLATAQSGQMRVAEPQLARLLQDPRGDGEEICEAFVIGYLRLRDYETALSLIEGWSRDYPNDPRSYFWAGQAFRDIHTTDMAEENFRKALEVQPRHAPSLVALGEILLEVKRAEEAEQFFRRALEDPLHRAAARVGLARSLRAQGQIQAAITTLNDLLKTQPRHLGARVERATLDIEAGQYEQAAARLAPLIKQNPNHRELRFAYATALRGLNKSEEAQREFEHANLLAEKIALANDLSAQLAERPQDAQLRFEIGRLHLEYGVAQEGLIWLHTALECDPSHIPAHELLAQYYADRFQTDRSFLGLAQKHQVLLQQIRAGSALPGGPTGPGSSNQLPQQGPIPLSSTPSLPAFEPPAPAEPVSTPPSSAVDTP